MRKNKINYKKKHSEEKSIFIASTPYHILLSTVMALKYSKEQNYQSKRYLILVNNFKGAELYKKALVLWENNPFYQIFLLPSNRDLGNKILYIIRIRKITSIISKTVKKLTPDVIYVFNDTSHYNQVALFIQHKLKYGRSIYIEDGIAPYSENVKIMESKIKQFLKRNIYGKYYQDLPYHASHSQINEMYVNFPKLINRKRYCNLKINEIDREVYTLLNETSFIKHIIKLNNIDTNNLKKFNFIVIFPKLDNLKKMLKYQKYVKIYVKYFWIKK